MKHSTLHIRFLRQGLVEVDMPSAFKSWTEDEKQRWANEILSAMNDKSLLETMADFTDPSKDGFFDSTPEAVAIETNKGETLITSFAWEVFKDPYVDCSYLSRLDAERKKAIEVFRQHHGNALAKKVLEDPSAPAGLKRIIKENNISYIGFELVTVSRDFMPDSCLYMYLSGDILIGFQTASRSSTWEECMYEYGDFDISGEGSLVEAVNCRGLLEKGMSLQEARAVCEYLEVTARDLMKKNKNTFDYLVEGEK